MGRSPKFLVKPDEEKNLIIAPLFGGALAREATQGGRANFYVSWRSGNSTWWWRRAVPVWTHTDTIRLTAGYDPVSDEGIAYAKRLEEGGVSVTAIHMNDQMHGFLTMGKIVRAADTALEMSAAALRRIFLL
jgi:acetyl esterase/lipase